MSSRWNTEIWTSLLYSGVYGCISHQELGQDLTSLSLALPDCSIVVGEDYDGAVSHHTVHSSPTVIRENVNVALPDCSIVVGEDYDGAVSHHTVHSSPTVIRELLEPLFHLDNILILWQRGDQHFQAALSTLQTENIHH